MKTIVGFDGLLSIYKERPEAWYFFTDVTMDNKKKVLELAFFIFLILVMKKRIWMICQINIKVG